MCVWSKLGNYLERKHSQSKIEERIGQEEITWVCSLIFVFSVWCELFVITQLFNKKCRTFPSGGCRSFSDRTTLNLLCSCFTFMILVICFLGSISGLLFGCNLELRLLLVSCLIQVLWELYWWFLGWYQKTNDWRWGRTKQGWGRRNKP